MGAAAHRHPRPALGGHLPHPASELRPGLPGCLHPLSAAVFKLPGYHVAQLPRPAA